MPEEGDVSTYALYFTATSTVSESVSQPLTACATYTPEVDNESMAAR